MTVSIQPVTDYNPFIERDPKDFLEPIPSLAERLFLTVRYTIEALPPYILVVDVSHWNKERDFAALRASGVQAIIIKCSEGAEGTYYEFKDPRFEENWRKALDEGFPVMVYHFFRDNKGSAEKSWFMKCADAFLNDQRVNGKTATWLDAEWTGSGISKTARASRAFGFCDLIKGEGMRQGIYSSPGLVPQLFPANDPRWANVFQWNAHWTSLPMFSIPSGWSLENIKGWQFGISNTHPWVPVINGAGKVDLSRFYFESEAALRSWLGQETVPPPPPTHEHQELQAQIDQLRLDIDYLYQKGVSVDDSILDLEARDTARALDIVAINKRLQKASAALAIGGGE